MRAWTLLVSTVDSNMEHECRRMFYAGVPSFFGLALEGGHVPTFWLALKVYGHDFCFALPTNHCAGFVSTACRMPLLWKYVPHPLADRFAEPQYRHCRIAHEGFPPCTIVWEFPGHLETSQKHNKMGSQSRN